MLKKIDIEAIGLANSLINLNNWGLGFISMFVEECNMTKTIDRTDSITSLGESVGNYQYANEYQIDLTGVYFKYLNNNQDRIITINNSTIIQSLITLQLVIPLPVSLPKYYTGLASIISSSIATNKGGSDKIDFSLKTLSPIVQDTEQNNFTATPVRGG